MEGRARFRTPRRERKIKISNLDPLPTVGSGSGGGSREWKGAKTTWSFGAGIIGLVVVGRHPCGWELGEGKLSHADNFSYVVAVRFMYCNFGCIHRSLRFAPAMTAGFRIAFGRSKKWRPLLNNCNRLIFQILQIRARDLISF